MKPTSAHRLPALLEAAAQRVKLAAREAVERTIESLGLAALASANAFQRDGLLGAQFELNRKSAFFALAFNEGIDERLLRENAPRSAADPTSWDALSLVEDLVVERKVAAERYALEIAHACEWELRELDAYMGSLMGTPQGPNPLRPEVIGLALLQGIETVSDRREIRSVLQSEIGRVLTSEMRGAYTAIVGDLRKAGVQPAGLSYKSGGDSPRRQPDHETHSPPMPPDGSDSLRGGGYAASRHTGIGSRPGAFASGQSRFGTHGSQRSTGGTPLGHVDAQLMSLIRRLAHGDAGRGSGDASTYDDGYHDGFNAGGGASLPPNLIHAHREELRQASTGSLDHMVIDIIGSLFDQILSDPKVPPQMARQIARLQLPVLRAALGDSSFFSSRRHPVRRFVNRIASLGAGFDDFAGADAQRFLVRVRALVDDIVEGDFDQIEVYDRKLAELEQFIADLAREEVQAQGDPAALLGEKEDVWRLTAYYSQQLQAELKDLAGPDFVRHFLTEVWSQVLVQAARKHGADAPVMQRMREVARELFMSVQPKGTPLQRKEFLAQLPRMMQGLNQGMDLVAWPESARKAFFGLLLPAHAESLKGQGMGILDFNMMSRRVGGAFGGALPRPDQLPPPDTDMPVLDDAVAEPRFSAAEAARVGLLEESKVDWAGKVDIDLAAEPELKAADIAIRGLPAPEALEATSGRGLADEVQLGFAYQMLIDGEWQKVKLAHVSAGRSFFAFTRGQRHRQTISMTRRMLVKLCETGRLRAFESAYLMERATARARRQLASISAPA
jgi:hypothetical protein